MMKFDRKLSIVMMFWLVVCVSRTNSAQQEVAMSDVGIFSHHQVQNPEKKIAQAEAYVAADKQLKAIEVYESIVKTNPDHLKSWQRLAQLYSWNDMGDKAVQSYEQIVRLSPSDTEAKKTLAQYYLWNDRQIKAIVLYEKILEDEPNNTEIYRKLAQLYSWNGLSAKAIHTYEQIIKLDEKDIATMKVLADQYFWDDRTDEGIRLLERIADLEPDSLQFRKKLAQQQSWNNQTKPAVEQYQIILEKSPEDKEILKKLAQQLMWNNQPADAAPLYERLIRLEPDSLNHKNQLARAYLWSGQSRKAEEPLLNVLKEKPLHKESLLSLAEIERWSGRWDQAKQRLEKLLLFYPENEQASVLLRDIRKNYGTLLEAKYSRLSDSNEITRETIPISTVFHRNRFWDFGYQAARYRVFDDRLDSTTVGYGAQAVVNYHPTVSSKLGIEIGAINYSSNWTPFSLKFQFSQTIKEKMTAQIRYERHETQEGVRALADRIVLNGLITEIYWQVFRRWAISGNYQQFSYSDDNQKISTTAATYLTLKLKNPNIVTFAYYLFEDFDKIYLNSRPYWTPNELSTGSIGLNLKQTISQFAEIGAGYAITRQQGINSNNFNGSLAINFSDFSRFFISYLKTGSEVYHSTNFIVSFQHRF